jgi:Leucine-rich repeat (LRR) protein
MAQIVSMRGLQHLTSLTYINVDYNSLQTINLSNLPNLQYADVSDCDVPGTNISSLKSFNLSGSTNILELRLDDSDFSSGINVSNLVNLEWLDVDQCNLPSLDVSGLSNLVYLDAWGNESMISLDISGCESLVDLDAFDCALTEASVNAILIELDTQGNIGGYVALDTGTNAAPTGLGVAAVISLQGKGWDVYYNGPTITTTTTAVPTTTTTTI